MHRAFSFPVTVERSRTKQHLEASLVGLCELELRKQRQECLVLGALALGDPPGDSPATHVCVFGFQSALKGSPWGLMQALEQQVEELRMDEAEGCDGAPGETGPRRSVVVASPIMLHCLFLQGDPLDGERQIPGVLPRSFSVPYPPMDNTTMDSWQWDQVWQQEPVEDPTTEEHYQQAMRVEGFIVGLIQRYALASRPCQPRTTLIPDTPGHNSIHRRTPCLFTENLLLDPVLLSQSDLSTNPTNQKWGCDLLEEEACGGEAPTLEGDSYLSLPYPQSRSHSLTERLPSPLPFIDPNSAIPPSPQNCIHPQLQSINHKPSLASSCFIPGQACHAPVHSSRPCNPVRSKSIQKATPDDHPNSKSKSTKKYHNERQRAKKSSSKTSRSQSENSLQGQQVLQERRYSTTERHQNNQVAGPQHANNIQSGNRRWCSNLELSQDEGETLTAQVHKRQQQKARSGHPGHPSTHPKPHHYNQYHHQRHRLDVQERAPLCQEEDSYAATIPAESESSMSEVYSPASSSLSSDSDESGGLVWPQQLPPRFASTSSSSSPSPQTTANATAQPKAFVKIKASHALKRKILRFRSGSLKVMTTV
uniref:Dishevelled-binding antagonist of beta-catenin 3a n=1 Tax=Takifugu rubripes TaxID=31033 RepID=A0A3B5K9R3_TAKRU